MEEMESQYRHVTETIQAIEDNIENIRQKLLQEGESWTDVENVSITQSEL